MKIIEHSGVSPVHKDTIRLAEVARAYGKHKVLDMGTGTGYVAIALAKAGSSVDATDINYAAIACAKENAVKNNISVNVFYSDLFEKVTGKYDLIIFNPPLGGVEPGWQVSIKAVIRKSILKNLVSRFVSRITQKKRIPFLKKVIDESFLHLNEEGILLLHIQSIDVPYLSRYNIKIIEKVFEHSTIVKLSL